MQEEPKIVVIDDVLKDNAPLMILLKEKYGENVILFSESTVGLDYILSNLSQKMVVILDLNFEAFGQFQGIEVFEKIREKTSLIYVIFMTVEKISRISQEDLKLMINNDAMAFINKQDGYDKVIEFVDKAIHQLDTRIDSVLEEWILRNPEDERRKPYIATRSGKIYSLNDLLQEVRNRTEMGKLMEKKMIYLTIDLLSRGKEKIDD